MKLSSSTLIFVIIMFSKMWFFKILAAILQSPFCKGRKRTESPLVSSFEWNNGVNAQASITTSLRDRLPFMLKWVEKMVRRWAWERSLSVPLSVITSLPLSHVVQGILLYTDHYSQGTQWGSFSHIRSLSSTAFALCVCSQTFTQRKLDTITKKQGKLRYNIISPNFEPLVMRNWQKCVC